MENEILKIKSNIPINYTKKKNNKIIIYLFFFFNVIYFIIIFLLIKIIFNLKNTLNKYFPILNNFEFFFSNNTKPISFNINDYVSKYIYNNDIQFYKDILQLYIENKTQFYIKGRQRNMKLGGKYYNESNITTIQDKLNWLIIHENPEYKANNIK